MKKKILFLVVLTSLCLSGCKTARDVSTTGTNQTLPTIENTQTDLFFNTTATKTFSEEVVTDAQIEKLLKAAINSPSESNNQPWHFTAVMKENLMKELVPNATKGCVVIIVSAPFGSDNDLNCGIAVQSINLMAQSMGLGANIYSDCIDAANSEELNPKLKIPEGYQAVTAICVGYPEADTISSASKRNEYDSFVTYVD